MAHAYEPRENEIFPPSWARRQGHGKLYGKTYIEKYLDDIKQMFQYGEVNSSNKMNASKMREQLILKYPNRFSLPGEIEIKKNIGAFAQKQQSAPKRTVTTRRRDLKPEWEKNLEEMVRQRWKEAPKVLYKDFVTLIGSDQDSWPNDLPTITTENNETSLDMKKIKAIISSVKQKVRKEGKRSLLN